MAEPTPTQPPQADAPSPRCPRSALYTSTPVRPHFATELSFTSLSRETFDAAMNWAMGVYETSPLVETLTSPTALEEFLKYSQHWLLVVNRNLLTPWAIEIEHRPFVQVLPFWRKLIAALCAQDERAFLCWVEIGFGLHSKTLHNVGTNRAITIDESWLATEDYRTPLAQYTPYVEACVIGHIGGHPIHSLETRRTDGAPIMADPIPDTIPPPTQEPPPSFLAARAARSDAERKERQDLARAAREDGRRAECYDKTLADTAFFAEQAATAALDYGAQRARGEPSTARALEALLDAAEAYHTAFRHTYIARLEAAGLDPKKLSPADCSDGPAAAQ